MQLEIDIEDWPEGDWEALAEHAAAAAGEVAPELANPRFVTSILLTSDARVHELNREWRQRDKPTNVLSFPMLAREDVVHLDPDDGPPEMLGDIALAYETCAQEAKAKGIAVADHTAHLIIHGLLHLAGHNHEISDEEADKMEALEVKALAHLGIGNPYTGTIS
ncbi:rRNA maturation RNase YbeY [Aurantiacibacter gangjinensis]|uniref:Endoribonuclease YbeY n=1 Tax=Aurantiacibacter gangjinensis TaxID=502682 RepID=A0A0G9MP61_9SPHN|nr:rRNA maturation RNase YbeY [Aurantiacibacter gangjinensis]APE28262.1 Metal-dependent hydrolase YbeY, involved in rRNA and/or ribosome maturation and assembly [Aurantiacibacter gangjinensis]KLE32507.1 rRNA maturation factor [Aurantiacibacter gangjinensis]